MNQNDRRRIQDITELAAELAEYVSQGQDHFNSHLSQVRAIERVIELIGEAGSSISIETQNEISGVDWSGLIGLRVLLAHNYQRVKKSQLWISATVDVPLLVKSLNKLV
ncbi:MAG: DUF86 domain-containing protein [Actinobacteria bacterium]|nr:DUF86 domain-containing protein [Actinomycetota bacterium]